MKKLQLLDVFAKTSEDAHVKTSSGGAVTLLAGVVLIWLLALQVRAYLTIAWDSSLIIDSSRGEKMTISMDITFPHLPCELLSIDAMDDAGDIQQDLDASVAKLDLAPGGSPLDPTIKQRQNEERDAAIAARGADYEASCYGADAGLPSGVTGCRTCEDLRRAFSTLKWQFHDGRGFSQCVEERYPDHVEENKHNGCRVTGNIQVSKVVGKLHFAPGQSFFTNGQHSHDLSRYNMADLPYDFSHRISQLSFGSQHSDSPLEDPLENYAALSEIKQYQFRYFLKVIGTDFHFQNGTTLQTNRYSVTHHERPLIGGRDEDHPHSAHNAGGIPGVWFNYDISPMKVVETESRQQNLGALLMNVFAIVGAVITTGAVVDRGVYAVDKALKARKER